MEDSNIVRTTTHLSQIKQGMTVEYRGQIRTVGKDDVKHCSMWGWRFQGDSSKQEITKIEFAVPTAKGIVLR